jgi:hypothetical protein
MIGYGATVIRCYDVRRGADSACTATTSNLSSDKQKFPTVRIRGFGEPKRVEAELPPSEPQPPPDQVIETPIEMEAPPEQPSPKKQRRSKQRAKVAEPQEPVQEAEPIEEKVSGEADQPSQFTPVGEIRPSRQSYPVDLDPIRKSRRQGWKDQIYNKVYPRQ